jgi:hypothetical protein
MNVNSTITDNNKKVQTTQIFHKRQMGKSNVLDPYNGILINNEKE